ncbi:hypothetical protein A6R68_08368 [Neotoma lepida]|uniref:Vomeronasal type-1 receptor n=1 Tax=Neotoma lepida TaxID=56216 RepID=A0A1A6G575_NEOLE|nr:hypothetical protein A6R68_08368 [Neotoma lepida]
MASFNGSMIAILQTQQRAQHIHSTLSSSRNSPESSVTQNILTLWIHILTYIVSNHRMDFWNLAIIFIFLSQTTIGILGNLSLMFYYLVLYCREWPLKPTDLILMHLTAANILIVLSVEVPQTMAVLGIKHFLNEFGCRILMYIQGLGRSMSISTTCLLSVFHALTISPRKSCWKDHKIKVEKNIGCHISLLWIMYIFINFIHFAYTPVNRNSKNVTRR